jgi:hypothetical protein
VHTTDAEGALVKPVHSAEADSTSSSTLSGQTSLLTSVVQNEKTFAKQIVVLPMAHRGYYNALNSKLELRSGGEAESFPDKLYLRFAMCGPEPFDFKSAWTIMKRFDRRYLNLSITSTENQLRTKVRLCKIQIEQLSRSCADDMDYLSYRQFPCCWSQVEERQWQ